MQVGILNASDFLELTVTKTDYGTLVSPQVTQGRSLFLMFFISFALERESDTAFQFRSKVGFGCHDMHRLAGFPSEPCI